MIYVIVPVYNAERYLEECIESILAQSMSDFKLIIVDDGSTDGSKAICDGFARRDGRVEVIHQKNKGQAMARNAGIDRAYENKDVQWLTFVDADDTIDRDFLKVMEKAANEAGVDQCVCPFTVDPAEMNAVRVEDNTAFEVFGPEDLFCAHPMPSIVLMAKLFAARCFAERRLADESLFEDAFSSYPIQFECSAIAYVNKPMYYYRQSENSVMRSEWRPEKFSTALRLYDERGEYFKSHGYKRAYRRNRICCIYDIYHQTKACERTGGYPDELKRMKKYLRRYIIRHFGSVAAFLLRGKR